VKATPEQPQFVKVTYLTDKADVHPDTIYRMIASGKLPAIRVGRHYRIPREAAEALLAGTL
jgi:excisionase family DNA binding protein